MGRCRRTGQTALASRCRAPGSRSGARRAWRGATARPGRAVASEAPPAAHGRPAAGDGRGGARARTRWQRRVGSGGAAALGRGPRGWRRLVVEAAVAQVAHDLLRLQRVLAPRALAAALEHLVEERERPAAPAGGGVLGGGLRRAPESAARPQRCSGCALGSVGAPYEAPGGQRKRCAQTGQAALSNERPHTRSSISPVLSFR